MYLLE